MEYWNSYNIWTFVVNCFTAIGTCGAVIFALLNSRKPKEKAEGFVEFVFNSNPPFIKFEITNTGQIDFIFNSLAGILLMASTDNEIISLNNTGENEVFIPTGAKRPFKYDLKLKGRSIVDLLNDKTCRIFVYTLMGTKIELNRAK